MDGRERSRGNAVTRGTRSLYWTTKGWLIPEERKGARISIPSGLRMICMIKCEFTRLVVGEAGLDHADPVYCSVRL
jgi:hypothetical protein